MDRRNILLASTTSVVSKNNYNYMTILALEDGLQAKLSGNTISYSLDEGNTWTSLASNTYTPTVNSGKTIMFKGNLTPNSSSGIGRFTINKRCNLEGNCMSLLFGDDAVNNNSLSGKNYAFYKLFSGCTSIIQVSESFLPATKLASYCYSYMFRGCTSLTSAPELPATTLADRCYGNMFRDCTSLTVAPELPATTLASECYYGMFWSCTSLTTAPTLPATKLASRCYGAMFYGANVLPDCSNIDFTSNTVVSSDGLRFLFAGTKVTDNDLYNILPINPSTGKYWLPATTLTDSCYSNMFEDCSSLTTAPELPATTLTSHCYYSMFRGCTSLTSTPELPATTLVQYCYYYMFYGCTSLTTAPSILPATTLTYCCYSFMFYDCSSLITAPELPATTLAEYCYNYMFYGCSSLNYIKMLATDISASNCLYSWVYRVASTGTFVKNPVMTSLPTGSSGIPSGWTVVEDIGGQ